MFFLKKWLRLAEFSGSTSRFDHQQKSVCIFNVMEIFIVKQDFLLCLRYHSAWNKATNAFVRSYGIRKSASLVVCLFSSDNQYVPDAYTICQL